MDRDEPTLPTREPPDLAPDPRRRPDARCPLAILAARGASVLRRPLSRREAIRLGGALGLGGFLAACTRRQSDDRPSAEWTVEADLDARGALPPELASSASPGKDGQPFGERLPQQPANPVGVTNPISPAALPYARPRWIWARGEPDYANINPMLPVTALTVHHDGLDDLIDSTDPRSSARRLERYRLGHRARGWADIGYHLVIDRGGMVWQGRSIRWQGAHVKDHNEGNIGVLVMGNFEIQRPTAAQVRSLDRVIHDLLWTYGISPEAVYTHREWPSARTLCPGRFLQPCVDGLRADLGQA